MWLTFAVAWLKRRIDSELTNDMHRPLHTHTCEDTLHLWSIAHYALVALRCITGSLAERAEMAERVERAESAERAERAGGPVVRRFHVRCCTYVQARKLIQRREKMCLCSCIIHNSDHQVSFANEFKYKKH